MMIELLNREKLILLNKALKYPLAIAEKDYFLAIVSKIIFDSKLSSKLIFKGGTALYHTYLPQLRFSEDLDFSSNATKLELDEVKNIFSNIDFLEIKKRLHFQCNNKNRKASVLRTANSAEFLKSRN